MPVQSGAIPESEGGKPEHIPNSYNKDDPVPTKRYNPATARQWSAMSKYLGELYPEAPKSKLWNWGVALERLEPGQWLMMGTATDATEGLVPRDGAKGGFSVKRVGEQSDK